MQNVVKRGVKRLKKRAKKCAKKGKKGESIGHAPDKKGAKRGVGQLVSDRTFILRSNLRTIWRTCKLLTHIINPFRKQLFSGFHFSHSFLAYRKTNKWGHNFTTRSLMPQGVQKQVYLFLKSSLRCKICKNPHIKKRYS